MNVTVNGVPEQLEGAVDINSLLKARGQAGPVAVAVNGEFVPRSSYDTQTLRDGDEIEIVAPMQGG